MKRSSFIKTSLGSFSLPMLESFGATEQSSPPKRLVQLGYGFGHTKDYFPESFGSDYELTDSLSPLQRHKNDFTMISNLCHIKHRNPHMGSTVYLTGADGPTSGKAFQNTVSCDQVAARSLGAETRFSSLVLTSPENGRGTGFGNGLSLSWGFDGKSLSGLATPFETYDSLFGGKNLSVEEKLSMLDKRKSVLDIYHVNLKSIQNRSSKLDKDKLDEFAQSLREIELRISKDKLWADVPKPKVDYSQPKKSLNGEEEIKTMCDLIILALQTDSTRVVTYRMPILSLIKSCGYSYDGHQLSHYGGSESRTTAAQARDKKQSELFAYFIDKLKTTKDSKGEPLFNSTLVSYGSNLRTGHMLKDVPAILTGNISGRLKHGRYIQMPVDTPLCNLWLSMLQMCGVEVQKFGDSHASIGELQMNA